MRTTAAILVLALAPAGCAGDRVAEQARAKRQLDELYRPLLALVVESRESVGAFLKVLGRDYVHPPGGELQGRERELWIEKIEKDLMPRNDRMCALIRGKRDLVDLGAPRHAGRRLPAEGAQRRPGRRRGHGEVVQAPPLGAERRITQQEHPAQRRGLARFRVNHAMSPSP